MAQPEPIGALDPTAPAVPDPAAAPRENVPHKKSPHAASNGTPGTHSRQPAYIGEALEDAERLLRYASELGISVDDDTRDSILQARTASNNGWDEQNGARLLTALAKLAAQVRPVTAASLRACISGTRAAVRNYWFVAICLAIIIVPFSLASFVASAISTTVKTDIATANDLAVKLRAQLGPAPPPGQAGTSAPANAVNQNDPATITELQQFAAAIRSIDARSRQLNALVFFAEKDPFARIRTDPTLVHDKFQLPEGLRNFAQAADARTTVYQDVRYFAQNVLDDVSFFYGAITACVLPVLYALLGTCAYLLRAFEQQMATRTFTPSAANSARFLIAGIGGAVVGLFNNFAIGQGASIPPLALAFLVGYAVDVFFAFLEGLLQTFTRSAANPASPTPPPGAKA